MPSTIRVGNIHVNPCRLFTRLYRTCHPYVVHVHHLSLRVSLALAQATEGLEIRETWSQVHRTAQVTVVRLHCLLAEKHLAFEHQHDPRCRDLPWPWINGLYLDHVQVSAHFDRQRRGAGRYDLAAASAVQTGRIGSVVARCHR